MDNFDNLAILWYNGPLFQSRVRFSDFSFLGQGFMARLSDNQFAGLMCVAPRTWRERVRQKLGDQSNETLWCDNVFDAIAVLSRQQTATEPTGTRQIVCILIDCLSRDEMGIFTSLAKYKHITTVAVSTMGNHRKMNQAKLLGADKVATLSELTLSRIGCTGGAGSPALVSEVATVIDNPTGEDVFATPVINKVPQPVKDPEPVISLTKEELDTLLG
jgi:hypothetical protein